MLKIKFIKRLVVVVIGFLLFASGYGYAANVQNQDQHYMQIAIDLAVKNNPRAPFAALIVDNKTGKILAAGIYQNRTSPILHGEMVAINNCIKKYPHLDWSKVTLYTTAEPCSMCQSAAVWMGIFRVVFASSSSYLISIGWHQINISSHWVNSRAPFYHGTITGGVLADKTNALFRAAELMSLKSTQK